MMVETNVAGIPCLVDAELTGGKPQGPTAESDWDCYGWEEITFVVCDRRGRPAPWLERKLTPKIVEQVEVDIREAYAYERDYGRF